MFLASNKRYSDNGLQWENNGITMGIQGDIMGFDVELMC